MELSKGWGDERQEGALSAAMRAKLCCLSHDVENPPVWEQKIIHDRIKQRPCIWSHPITDLQLSFHMLRLTYNTFSNSKSTVLLLLLKCFSHIPRLQCAFGSSNLWVMINTVKTFNGIEQNKLEFLSWWVDFVEFNFRLTCTHITRYIYICMHFCFGLQWDCISYMDMVKKKIYCSTQ